MACEPSPPAIASASAPLVTASRTSRSRSHGGPSSIGSIPRERASEASANFSALPPPDLGLKNRTGRCGPGAGPSSARMTKAARPSTHATTRAAADEQCLDQAIADEQRDRDAYSDGADHQPDDACLASDG